MYCICVWGNAPRSHLDPLLKLQKRAVRIIYGAKYREHTSPLFQNLKIMNLYNIYIYNILLIMFKHHHGKLPTIFDSFFTRNNEVHSYDTRQSNNLHVPKQKTVRSAQLIRSAGVALYNHFVTRLNFGVTFSTFKKNVKGYLLKNEVHFPFQ